MAAGPHERPVPGVEHKENRYYKNVLEVFDFDDAERIAEAMNKN